MPKIKVGFSFLLFNALVFMFRESSLIWGFYAACIIHEVGHIAAVKASGGKINAVSFSWFGIKIAATPPPSLTWGMIVLLSGPLANLVTFLLLYLPGKTGYFSLFSLAEGLFNLLPYSFLDGGAALELLAEGSENEHILRKILTALRFAVTVVIISLLVK